MCFADSFTGKGRYGNAQGIYFPRQKGTGRNGKMTERKLHNGSLNSEKYWVRPCESRTDIICCHDRSYFDLSRSSCCSREG